MTVGDSTAKDPFDLGPPMPRKAVAAPAPAVVPAYRLWFDGSASEGGNGELACGMVVLHPDGERHRAPFMAGRGTNNEAEYIALIAGLRYLAGVILGNASVVVHGDSQLVINQVFGNWKVRAPNLYRFHAEARSVVAALKESGVAVRGEWVRREDNTEADALCELARRGAKG